MNYEMLLEKKLTTDFTMGFELEAIWNEDNVPYSDIEEFFDDEFAPGGEVHGDGSLRCDEDIETDFEYASPVLPVNMATFNKIIKFYDKHLGEEFYVNDSCGYHHHISFPGITAEDVVWIMCHLAITPSMLNNLKYFKNYDFETSWSGADYFDDLKDAVEDMDFNNIINLCRTEKYSLINVHSQKTIEWRGPRGFLQNENTQEIREFYIQFWKFIQWIVDTLDLNTINDMDKDNFLEQVRIAMKGQKLLTIKNFDLSRKRMKNGLMDESTLNKHYQEIINNPKALMKFVNNKGPLEQIIQLMYNKDRLGKRIVQLNNELGMDTMKRINNICYKYIPYRMLVQYNDSIDEDTKYNTSEMTMKRLMATSRMDGQSITPSDIASVFYDNYKSFNSEMLFAPAVVEKFKNDVFTSVIANKDEDLSFLKIILQSPEYFDTTIKDNIVNSYLQKREYSINIIKTLIRDFGHDEQTLRTIYKNLYMNVFTNPSVIIPLLTFNEKSLYLLIAKAKRNNNTEYFYDTFKPLMINNGKITEEEFNNIDREITKRAQPTRATTQSDEDMFDDEEISF